MSVAERARRVAIANVIVDMYAVVVPPNGREDQGDDHTDDQEQILTE